MSPGYCELKFEQVNKVAMSKWTPQPLASVAGGIVCRREGKVLAAELP